MDTRDLEIRELIVNVEGFELVQGKDEECPLQLGRVVIRGVEGVDLLACRQVHHPRNGLRFDLGIVVGRDARDTVCPIAHVEVSVFAGLSVLLE